MTEKNIRLVRGDTLSFAIEIEGLETDLASVRFTAKSNYNGDTLFSKTLDNGGVTKVENGIYRVRVAPIDTKDAIPATYYYDLEIGVNSDIFTIMRGLLELLHDVSEA